MRSSVLRSVSEQSCRPFSMSEQAWDWLKRRTQEEAFGRFDDTGYFQIYRPYLEQCVTYEPSTKDKEALLEILMEERDHDGLLYVGLSLGENLPLSGRAFRAAIHTGSTGGYAGLGAWYL